MKSLGTRAKIGFWLAVVLAVADVASTVLTPSPPEGQDGPPLEVLVFSGLMGVVTLVAAVVVLRSGSRAALRVMAVSRVLSALTALPAFFVPNVPPEFVAFGAATVVLTIVAVVLLMSRARQGAHRTAAA